MKDLIIKLIIKRLY